MSSANLTVHNPADTDETIAELAVAGESEIAAAVAAAAHAAEAWRVTAATERAAILIRAADELERQAAELAIDLVRESGKILADARSEVARAAATLRFFAGEAQAGLGETLPPIRPGSISLSRRMPIGVVGVISPFNFPYLVPAWKLGGALAYGNAVVWKPSELTPLSARHIVRAFRTARLPGGVLQLVEGGGTTGALLAAHPDVAGLTFTGSTPVGRAIERANAGRGLALQLEMGGKNAAVVLDDAALVPSAKAIVAGALAGAGQKCTAISRVICAADRVEEVGAALAAEVAGWPVGNGLDERARVGPLITAAAAERALEAIAEASAAGARVLVGGARPEDPGLARGHFVEPTVLAGMEPAMRLACEEVFAPILVVLGASDDEDAVRLVNATPYGLNAAVFTRDLERALAFVEGIESGMVQVNAVAGLQPYMPFGGWGDSGFGAPEQGTAARPFFTRTQVVNVHPAP